MRFAFSEDQLLLQETLREFLRKELPPARIRELWASETGRSAALWSGLAELGVLGVRVDERWGGLGLDEVSAVLLFEEVGRAALAEPVLETALVGAPLLAELGDPERAEAWLPRLARGEVRLAVGHPVSPFVADAHLADLLLLGSGDELHLLERGAFGFTAQPSDDPGERLFTVAWRASAATRVAEGSRARELLDRALDRAALGCAAQQIGVASALLERSVAYACERKQFGVPIGSFQAVKHMLADVAVELEYARPLVYRAADSVARGLATRACDVSMAKLAASEAALRAARVALQVHGAIGYTWEQDLHIGMRRAWSLDRAWGTRAWHRARLGRALLDGEGRVASFGYEPPGEAPRSSEARHSETGGAQ